MITTKVIDARVMASQSPVIGPKLSLLPSKIGLVARDRKLNIERTDARLARWSFGPRLSKIIEACSNEGCDTIVFSLWTVKEIQWKTLFPPRTTHNSVILSVGADSESEMVQVWVRSNRVPVQVRQSFAKSSDAGHLKEQFVQQLRERIWGEAALIICGESNILKIPRGSRLALDRYGALRVLSKAGVRIILNPIHTYMRRYEMPIKRQCFSRGRFVVSVWNRGFVSGNESQIPWQAFRNQKDISAQIREISNPELGKLGVRLGVLDTG